ncbi:FAD-dependent oxidoreductase [Halomonas denitrificans]|uniref:FAD-dependent oxidoreductase n=1 Tax=Halomonas denitrificans TaxID=370769 RepID=UPI001CD7C6F3|nr:FAD-dependent oxidoreductase [Halomonas denitrificans]MCA0974203.1 FAD-dependent oxidoreductase [Halomonas denitrificans]
MQAPLTIIGTGMAGIGLVRQVRALDARRPITLITADSGDDYSKPLLSTGFAKGLAADRLAARSALELADQLNVVVRTHTWVDRIDTASSCLWIGQERLPWSDLVLATGASPIAPFAIPAELSGRVFSINDLDDYRRFSAILDGLERPARVAVIGLGLVGCEFANDLQAGGHQVVMVGPEPTLLPRLLPQQPGQALGNAFRDAGIEIRSGRLVDSVARQAAGDEQEIVLRLDDGQTLSADLVLVATGLRPRSQLAEAAGIRTGPDGIQVDRYLSTSCPRIHALGDVASVDGVNAMYVQPLQASAKALAATLCGSPTPVSYGPWPVLVKTPLLPVVALPPASERVQWRIEADGDDISALAEDEQGQLKGFALTGKCVRRKVELARAAPPLLG